MGRIYQNVLELIGRTPIIEAGNLRREEGLKARLLLKLESFNPAGSVKDRVALEMVEDAERKGLLKTGATIIEPTSGNTGIGLAAVAAARGYKAVFTMPETMSIERRKLLKGYGAQIVLTDGAKGMKGAIEKAEELNAADENAVMFGQFSNPANPQAHLKTTGPEIWEDTDGQVDMFVAGVGTGGTITGTGQYLKAKKRDIKVIAVEPAASPVLAGGNAGPHKLQGIGAGFIPEILDTEVYDQIVPVTEQEAYEAARKLAFCEGLLVGVSSGAALHAGMELARRSEYAGSSIVVLLPDTGERYLSTPLFDD